MKNSRERIFAIIVACVAVLIVGYFAYGWVAGQFSRRTAEITRLTDEIKKFDRTANLGRAAARKISQYEERSLPANLEFASTHYQTWLVNEMELAGLIEPNMRLVTEQGGDKDLFVKQSLQIDANGTLPQVVELLHAFYSVDWLHRITRLTLRPVKDSKLLDITVHIETLSLRKATSTDKLQLRPSNRLALASRDAYYDAIVGRNVFGPRNNEPKISLSGSQDVFLGREADLTVKWTDPDPFDQVYFNLVESAAPDAKLDPVTGKFTWTPKEAGTYEFVVEGADDGFPTKVSNREKIVINVRPQGDPPKPTIFDFAKSTILTALLDVDGQGEVWLHVRPTGQMVTLHQGDQFEIGSVKGTVSQIGEYDFCFDFEGKRRKLGKGEWLEEAKVIGDVPQIAAPAVAVEQASGGP
ncbi:MAG TPA: hypothetical protein VKH44_05270 [Pirellulaceae bacterium]|nr:hypothetical protein [Pirellulaceae bacterium]